MRRTSSCQRQRHGGPRRLAIRLFASNCRYATWIDSVNVTAADDQDTMNLGHSISKYACAATVFLLLSMPALAAEERGQRPSPAEPAGSSKTDAGGGKLESRGMKTLEDVFSQMFTQPKNCVPRYELSYDVEKKQSTGGILESLGDVRLREVLDEDVVFTTTLKFYGLTVTALSIPLKGVPEGGFAIALKASPRKVQATIRTATGRLIPIVSTGKIAANWKSEINRIDSSTSAIACVHSVVTAD